MEKATDVILQYGILGAVFIISIIIASKVIITLFKGNEEKTRLLIDEMNKKHEQQRKDFEEMRDVARGEAFTAAEEGRKAIDNNTRVLERVEDILMKLLTQKI